MDRLARVVRHTALWIDAPILQRVTDALSMIGEEAWSYQYVLSLLSPHDVKEYHAIVNGGAAFQRASVTLRDSLLSVLSVSDSDPSDPGARIVTERSGGFSLSDSAVYDSLIRSPPIVQPRPYVPLFLLPSPS